MPFRKLFSDEKSSMKSDDIPPQQPPAYTPTTTASSSTTPYQTRFASLSLHREDTLRLLRFPPELVPLSRQTIEKAWHRGIQKEGEYAGSHEFRLHGHPWRGNSDNAVEARRLVCAVLGMLHSHGWVLTLNTSISKDPYDKDTLLFRHQDPAPVECEWASISFSRNDRIRFIDFPSDIRSVAVSKMDSS